MITQAPRGVEDWYGERMHKRAWVEKQARELARTYNMTEIITPIFEHTVLFQRGVGGDNSWGAKPHADACFAVEKGMTFSFSIQKQNG